MNSEFRRVEIVLNRNLEKLCIWPVVMFFVILIVVLFSLLAIVSAHSCIILAVKLSILFF